jgi:ABC-type glutathione transport system ATPase component
MSNDLAHINKDELLLEVNNLKKYYPVRSGLIRRSKGWVKAVDGVSLFVKKGERMRQNHRRTHHHPFAGPNRR